MDKEFEEIFTRVMTRLYIELECTTKRFFDNPKNELIVSALVQLLDITCDPEDYKNQNNVDLIFPNTDHPLEQCIKDVWRVVRVYGVKRFIQQVGGWRHIEDCRSIYNSLIKIFNLKVEERFQPQCSEYIFNEFSEERQTLFSKGFSQS